MSAPGGGLVWGEAARALFALRGPTAVSAGAGSGKTTCLVELCLRLLSGEATGEACDPSQLVAITFTERAAAELEERLRAALAARAVEAARTDADEGRAWRRRLQGADHMAIGTIHAFAGRLLREHAPEAGLDPDFAVLEEEEAQAWRRAAAEGAVLEALDAGRPEARALAGGSGAAARRGSLAEAVCEVARERATLGERGPPRPAPDAAPAALEARDRMFAAADALLSARAEVRTRSGGEALGRLAEAAAAAAAERTGPLRPALLGRAEALGRAVGAWRVGKSDGERAPALREALREACEALGPLAAEALAGPQKRELCALVAAAEARYEARKAAARALDFDDLLSRARDLLAGDAALRAELRGRLRALLVDEYQDVNPLQQELFELLTGEGEIPGAGARPLVPIVAVGDLKQSIYRFRGADVAVFRGVLERFGRGDGGGRALHLSDNHRSSPAVLELVNEVFARAMRPAGPGARPYELAFGPADRLAAVRRGGDGPACEVLEDGEGSGVRARSSEDRREREARAIAARVRALVGGAAGVAVRERPAAPGGEERLRRPRFADVAVLFRRLTQLAPYERALREAGVPYRLARGGGFYQAPEVRDLGELLASLASPDDAQAWAALLRSPLCGLGDGALFALSRLGLPALARRTPAEAAEALAAAWPGAARPWPGSALPSTEVERLRRFLEAWRALRARLDRLPPHALLAEAAAALDLEAAHLAAPDGERRVANLRKALALAERFARGGGTAAAFAARLRAQAGRPPREPEAELEAGDAVALLSVHQAKGLEWPVVFVPDLGATPPADGRRLLRGPGGELAASFYDAASDEHHATAALAAARAEGRRAAAAESRRLLYVALTRARDRLVLSGEAGRGETWRGLVEAALAARPELAVRIPLVEAGTWAVGDGAPPAPADEAAAAPPAPAPAPPPPAATAPRPPPGPPAVRVAVTELAEHARCPRRLFLLRHLGVPERLRAASAGRDDPDRATARGTLAHAMLSEVDLAAPPLPRRAQLAAAAARRGYDPASPGVRRILADVVRFLDAPPGRRLAEAARAGALSREVPFQLRLGGDDGLPACYLVGAVDALRVDRGRVEVLDFKYAVGRAGAAERYRLQLLAYALAAGRAFPGRRVTAALQFLRGGLATVDVTPEEAELRRFAREAPRLAAEAAAWTALRRSPAELGRGPERCRADGCGYVERCHGGGAAGDRGCSPSE